VQENQHVKAMLWYSKSGNPKLRLVMKMPSLFDADFLELYKLVN